MDSSGNSFQVYDYRDILSSIGGVLQSHSIQNHDDISTVNENMRKIFEIEDRGELQVAPTDDTEYSVDTSEVDIEMDKVSRWGFDFGMGSNPIGEIFTALLGNPPTNFGTLDTAWDVEIPIIGGASKAGSGLSVRSTFKLTDWFPKSFRSFVLFCATVVFTIASAKSIKGAFQ